MSVGNRKMGAVKRADAVRPQANIFDSSYLVAYATDLPDANHLIADDRYAAEEVLQCLLGGKRDRDTADPKSGHGCRHVKAQNGNHDQHGDDYHKHFKDPLSGHAVSTGEHHDVRFGRICHGRDRYDGEKRTLQGLRFSDHPITRSSDLPSRDPNLPICPGLGRGSPDAPDLLRFQITQFWLRPPHQCHPCLSLVTFSAFLSPDPPMTRSPDSYPPPPLQPCQPMKQR